MQSRGPGNTHCFIVFLACAPGRVLLRWVHTAAACLPAGGAASTWTDDYGTPLGLSKAELQKAQDELARLEKDKEEMAKYHSVPFDFGPNNVFTPLVGRCIAVHQTRCGLRCCFETVHWVNQLQDL